MSAALFVVAGETAARIEEQLELLGERAEKLHGTEIAHFAREWHQSQIHSNAAGKLLAIVTESIDQLASQIGLCSDQIASICAASDSAPVTR